MHSADSHACSAQESASLGTVAQETAKYVQAWSTLLASETKLAKASLLRLAIAILVVPALVLAVGITLDAVAAALLQRWLVDWSSSLAIVLGLNLIALFALVFAMRRWWHNLSLPRSRDALAQLLERFA